MTPSARSVKHLRDRGFIVAPVEQIVHMPGRPFSNKRDAFGFGDLLIARPEFGAALVQVTSATNVSHRIDKILGVPEDASDPKSVETAKLVRANAETWIRSGNRLFVHGWAKKGPRGERKRWTLSERELTLSDFVGSPQVFEIPAA